MNPLGEVIKLFLTGRYWLMNEGGIRKQHFDFSPNCSADAKTSREKI